MHDHSVSIEIEKAELIAIEIIRAPIPNNVLEEFSYEKQIDICKSIMYLKNLDFNNLIGSVETILCRISIPDVDHSVADYDILMFKARIGEVIYCLNRISAAARACGYSDPYASGSQINAHLYKRQLSEVAEKLEYVRSQLDELNADIKKIDLKKDEMSGISIEIGPVSADISALKNIVIKGIDFIKTSPVINGEAMKDILSIIQQNSILLYNKFKNKLYNYGKYINRIAHNIAIGSSEALRIGLELIESSVMENMSNLEAADSLRNEVANNLVSILLENNIKAKFNNIRSDKSKWYIYTYASIVRGVYTLTMDMVINKDKSHRSTKISIGYFRITKHQFEIFDKIGVEKLSSIAYDVVYRTL